MRPKRLPPTVIWLGVVSLLNDFSSEMIFPLLPLFLTTVLGAGGTALGAMEGLTESVASLLKLASGRLGDFMPRRKPLVLCGYGVANLTRPFLAIATLPWHVVTLRVMDRIGKGLRGAPRDALITDTVEPATRGRAFGFHRAMDHLGAIAGPATALLLIPLLFGSRPLREGDYRLLFALAAIPALLSLVVLFFLVHEPPRSPTTEADAKGGRAKLDRSFWTLLAILVLFTLGNSSDAFLLARASSLGLSARDLYLIWALLHVVKAGLSVPAGALSDRMPRRYLIAGGWLVYAAVYWGFAAAAEAWHVWALFAAYGIYFGMVEGTERALVADLAPIAARSTAFGWYNGAIGIAALPASLVFGVLWDWRGPSLAFGFGAGLALAAAVLLLCLVRTPPTAAAQEG